jgi:predicted membrane protein
MTQNLPTTHPYSITADNNVYYVVFGVAKSPNSIFISREVQKISTVFSFIGGLIGAIMAALFIINSYTSFAFELSIALSIFKRDQKT